MDVLYSVQWIADSLNVKIHFHVLTKDAIGCLAWKNWRYDM